MKRLIVFLTHLSDTTVLFLIGLGNEETYRQALFFICRQPRRPWDKLWQNLHWFQ